LFGNQLLAATGSDTRTTETRVTAAKHTCLLLRLRVRIERVVCFLVARSRFCFLVARSRVCFQAGSSQTRALLPSVLQS